MISKYKHISFDLDGTLVHTVKEYRHRIVPEIVEQLGGRIDEPHHVDRFWFEAGRNVLIQDLFCVNPKEFWEVFHIMDTPEDRFAHTHAYEDAALALAKIKGTGKHISIITGAPAWIAEMEIKKLEGAPYDYFCSIVSGSFHEKPDTGAMLHTLKEMGQRIGETLYIGNSNEDAAFAQKSGCDFLYIDRGEHTFDTLEWAPQKVSSLHDIF